MSLALAENPQVAQALSIGSSGIPSLIQSPNGQVGVNCSDVGNTLQSYGATTRFETTTGANSAYVDIRDNGAEMYCSLNAQGTSNVGHVKVGGLVSNTGLYVSDTQLLYNGSAIGSGSGDVASVQGLQGAITFTSSNDTINFNNTTTTNIDITANITPNVSSLSDGTTALTGAITLIGEGCSITATQDPSPAITISIPAPPESGVVSISDGTNVATGAVVLEAGEGIEITYDTDQNTFTLTSDPFVGIYYLTTPQDITLVPPTQVQKVVGLTADPNTDSAIVSYDAGLGTWIVQKSGVYFLNFSAGIIQNNATWTFGSFCQCYIVCILGGSSPQLEICNNATPSPTSGVNSFNAQVFGYLPLTVGTTITAGIQWIITSAGTPTPAQFQPRVNNVNNGTGFNWAYVKPLTA